MDENRSPSRRKLIEGSTLGAGVLMAALLLGFVNYFGWKYHQRFDWTATRLYSLSDQSLNVLKGLDKDFQVFVFTSPSARLADPVRELLSRYEAAAPAHVKVREIDPVKNMLEAQQLLEKYQTGYNENTVKVVFATADGKRILDQNDLVDLDFSSVQYYGQSPEIKGFKGEQAFTSALVALASNDKPKILVTTGHGEAKLDSRTPDGLAGLQELLTRDNVDLEEWTSLGATEVPEGTRLIIVPGPTASFVQPELDVFSAYLDHGGHMLLLLDPVLSQGGTAGLVDLGLKDWLARWGVRLDDDIVVDPGSEIPLFGPETIFVKDYTEHPITHAAKQQELRTIFQLSRSVAKTGTPPAGLTVTELLRTSAKGWGETDLAHLRAVAKDDKDVTGPAPLGVAVEPAAKEAAKAADADADEPKKPGDEGNEADKPADPPADPAADPAATDAAKPKPAAETAPAPKPELRLVVFGDSDFARNAQLGNAGNVTLIDNAVNWLVERKALLGIPPKKPEQVRLSLDKGQVLRVYGLIALLPLLAIVAGVAVYLRRRR